MTLPTLLLGLLLAAFIFAAFGWSIARAVQTSGRSRTAHVVLAGLILLGMALLSLDWPLAARLAGAALIVSGCLAALVEDGWSRLLPLFGAAFGLALLLGLPFAG